MGYALISQIYSIVISSSDKSNLSDGEIEAECLVTGGQAIPNGLRELFHIFRMVMTAMLPMLAYWLAYFLISYSDEPPLVLSGTKSYSCPVYIIPTG